MGRNISNSRTRFLFSVRSLRLCVVRWSWFSFIADKIYAESTNVFSDSRGNTTCAIVGCEGEWHR